MNNMKLFTVINIVVLVVAVLFNECAAEELSPFNSLAPLIVIKKGGRDWEMDTDAMITLRSKDFPTKQLIERCKEVIDNQIGLFNEDDLADDFVFQFPIITLNREEYLESIQQVDFISAFPDNNLVYYDFRPDPFQAGKILFTSLFCGTHTGYTKGLGKATGKYVELPPQACSLSFNEDGKVTKFTGGYVIDKSKGNSEGLGGFFGIFHAIGRTLPFPEGKPYRPSLRLRFFQFLGRLRRGSRLFGSKVSRVSSKIGHKVSGESSKLGHKISGETDKLGHELGSKANKAGSNIGNTAIKVSNEVSRGAKQVSHTVSTGAGRLFHHDSKPNFFNK